MECGDKNLPETNWNTNSSSSDDENSSLEFFEEAPFNQAVDFPTCCQNVILVAFNWNCLFFFREKHLIFTLLDDWSNPEAVHTTWEYTVTDSKPALQNCRSSGNEHNECTKNYLAVNPFQPICHTNNNKICEELYQYLGQMIEIYVPRRARNRQCLAPWRTSHTSILLTELKTQTAMLEKKAPRLPEARSSKAREPVNWFFIAGPDSVPRKTTRLNKHWCKLQTLKVPGKLLSLPEIMISCNIRSTNFKERLDLLNDFLQPVFYPQHKFSRTDIKTKNPLRTNFNIWKPTNREIVKQIDVAKSWGPNGFPPAFFQNTSRENSKTLNKPFKNFKRLRIIPDNWKTTLLLNQFTNSRIHKRSVTTDQSLYWTSKPNFSKNIYRALYNHFIF